MLSTTFRLARLLPTWKEKDGDGGDGAQVHGSFNLGGRPNDQPEALGDQAGPDAHEKEHEEPLRVQRLWRHEVCDEDVDKGVDDLEGEVGAGFGKVVGLKGQSERNKYNMSSYYINIIIWKICLFVDVAYNVRFKYILYVKCIF